MEFPWEEFPPLKYVAAYGSRIFSGAADSDKLKQLDFIFVPAIPANEWHRQNLNLNAAHYSFVKYFRSAAISRIQEVGNTKIYYNTFSALNNGTLCKYGVINENHLLDDLMRWTSLYTSGRFHKAIVLTGPNSLQATQLNIWPFLITNRIMALKTALLLLPEHFTLHNLLTTICNISYSGDIRSQLFESPQKVTRMVESQLVELLAIYLPLLKNCQPQFNHFLQNPLLHTLSTPDFNSNVVNYPLNQSLNNSTERFLPAHTIAELSKLSHSITFQQNVSEAARMELYEALPARIRANAEAVSARYRLQWLYSPYSLLSTRRLSAGWLGGKPMPYHKLCVSYAIRSVVRRSSISSCLKCGISAGPTKSMYYLSRKFIRAR